MDTSEKSRAYMYGILVAQNRHFSSVWIRSQLYIRTGLEDTFKSLVLAEWRLFTLDEFINQNIPFGSSKAVIQARLRTRDNSKKYARDLCECSGRGV